MNKIVVKTPGKLMLTGEWNILESGHSCIVLAVNRFVTVTVTQAQSWSITSSLFPNTRFFFTWNYTQGITITTDLNSEQKSLLHLCIVAIEITLKYNAIHTDELMYCSIDLNTQELFADTIQKFGFGSSAALSVALIEGLLTFFLKKKPDNLIIFKLAYLAHYKAQGKCGSGFDIASASFGSSVIYQSPNQKWLHNQFQNKKINLINVIKKEWPTLTINPIQIPNNFYLNIGYSGISATTSILIKKIQHYAHTNRQEYLAIMNDIEAIVQAVIITLKTIIAPLKLINLIKENRLLLKKLADKAHVTLEIKELTQLIDLAENIGAGAKFSGAGGGDCAIAISPSENLQKTIHQAWTISGFTIVNTTITQ